jgi:hypothetical protein
VSILKRLIGSRDRQNAPLSSTVRDLLIARTPPWDRVAPIVIDTILKSITDKGLLEAFVRASIDAGLVANYEVLTSDTSPALIRARISKILAQTGTAALPSLAAALDAKQMDAGLKALTLAGDMLEAAIVLAENQIAAYVGLAAMYASVGKRSESHKFASGLDELDKLRADPAGQALRFSTVFPVGMLDEAERELIRYL